MILLFPASFITLSFSHSDSLSVLILFLPLLLSFSFSLSPSLFYSCCFPPSIYLSLSVTLTHLQSFSHSLLCSLSSPPSHGFSNRKRKTANECFFFFPVNSCRLGNLSIPDIILSTWQNHPGGIKEVFFEAAHLRRDARHGLNCMSHCCGHSNLKLFGEFHTAHGLQFHMQLSFI